MQVQLNMKLRLIAGMVIVGSIALVGCGGSGGTSPSNNQNQSVAHTWTDELLICIRASGPGPTANSRAAGMVTSAMYDAYAILDPQALAVYTKDELLIKPRGNTEVAVCQAAYRTLVDLFPTHQPTLAAKLRAMGGNPDDAKTGITNAIEIGNLAAKNLLEARHSDGSNQLNNYADTSGYVPINTVDTLVDPNHWQPVKFTFPDGSTKVPPFLTPHWGKVKPFALSSGSELRLGPGYRFGTPEYKAQCDELIELQTDLTDKQKCIAEYWADGPRSETPPGHWVLLAQHIAQSNNFDLRKEVKLYFLVGNAVMDAGIAAWDSKAALDYVRPISAIRKLYTEHKIYGWAGAGQGIQIIDGKDWKPYQPDHFVTPPFAELPSGHSTFSSASAEVIRRFQGNDILDFAVNFAPGESHYEPGVTPANPEILYYPTLTSAAEDAGRSRLYGGIHFRMGNEEGLRIGKIIGEKVFNKAAALFEGRRIP